MDIIKVTGADNDAATIAAVLNGDVNAFSKLLDRYETDVVKIVAAKVPRECIPDVVHETFVAAYKSLKGFKGEKPFSHWLSRIAVRSCYDFWREHYRKHDIPISALSEDAGAWMETLALDQSLYASEESAERMEARELLNWALSNLSPGDRMVLILIHLEGYSVNEAADLLGWSGANVKVRSFRARNKLRRIISNTLKRGEKE